MAYQPVLTSHVREPNAFTLDFYRKNLRGYEGLKKALTLKPNDIIEQVKASGLRGRGGAGFPTGMKWQFVLKDTPKPKYICCNADESEPGTFKDHVLMERNPHLLIEGCAISCYAIGAKVAYIYIRGEFYHVQQILEAEIEKAYKAGYLGKNILGSGFDCDVYVHRGAGAYEAGEETALIESLEGKRAQPRIKPPFPAVAGLYQCPTAVNNVETLCNIPLIVLNGPQWFASLGPEKNGGPKLFHEPCSDISWRRKCWKVLLSSCTSGTGMPMKVTCAPGPASMMAALMVASNPTASMTTSARRAFDARSFDRMRIEAPASRASSSFSSETSTAMTSPAPIILSHWMANRPIGPQPTTAPVLPTVMPPAFQIDGGIEVHGRGARGED